MSGTLVQPQGGNRPMMRRQEENDPFFVFRREMGRLFDDVLASPLLPGFPLPVAARVMPMPLTPKLEVSESDKEFRVTAEMPGIDPQNVEISLEDDLLNIRAEKVAEQQQDGDGRNFHVRERSYGTFSRYLRLPFAPDPNQIQASFKDGVLTVTIPKPESLQRKVHRIEVAADANSGNGSDPARQPKSEQQSQSAQQSQSGGAQQTS